MERLGGTNTNTMMLSSKSNTYLLFASKSFMNNQLRYHQHQLRYRYHHHRCHHHHHDHQPRADEMKLVTSPQSLPVSSSSTHIIKAGGKLMFSGGGTGTLTVVGPVSKPKPKPRLKFKVIERIVIGGLAITGLGLVLFPFQCSPREPSSSVSVGCHYMITTSSNASCQLICSQEDSTTTDPTVGLHFVWCLFLLICSVGIVSINEQRHKNNNNGVGSLALNTLGVMFILGFVSSAFWTMSTAHAIDSYYLSIQPASITPFCNRGKALLTILFFICFIGSFSIPDYRQFKKSKRKSKRLRAKSKRGATFGNKANSSPGLDQHLLLYRESELILVNVLGVSNAAQRKLLAELGIRDFGLKMYQLIRYFLYRLENTC